MVQSDLGINEGGRRPCVASERGQVPFELLLEMPHAVIVSCDTSDSCASHASEEVEELTDEHRLRIDVFVCEKLDSRWQGRCIEPSTVSEPLGSESTCTWAPDSRCSPS